MLQNPANKGILQGLYGKTFEIADYTEGNQSLSVRARHLIQQFNEFFISSLGSYG